MYRCCDNCKKKDSCGLGYRPGCGYRHQIIIEKKYCYCIEKNPEPDTFLECMICLKCGNEIEKTRKEVVLNGN